MHGDDAEVRLHVYDLDGVSGWFNGAILKPLDLGVFHVGVEVYSSEWSFQYFEDVWEDDSLSGVLPNKPAEHPMFIYRETISMGRTPLSIKETWKLILHMMTVWPANSYHLTQRNCICFAEELCKALMVPTEFPEWTAGVAAFSNKYTPLRSAVDFGWTTAKNRMIAKSKEPVADEEDELDMPNYATESVIPFLPHDLGPLRVYKHSKVPPIRSHSPPSPMSAASAPPCHTGTVLGTTFRFPSVPTQQPRISSGGSVSSACSSPALVHRVPKERKPQCPTGSTSSSLRPLFFGDDSDPSVSDDGSVADEGSTQCLDWTTPPNPGGDALLDEGRRGVSSWSIADEYSAKVETSRDGFSVADEGRRRRIEATPCRRSDVKDEGVAEEGIRPEAPYAVEATMLTGTDDLPLYVAYARGGMHRYVELEAERSSASSRSASVMMEDAEGNTTPAYDTYR
eukprot:GEMP01026846.1.p1 GENE.GEMP01026846.1~~GEMP01026846.1.p1  ORF type:complete len:454 (+),score=109.53 GEMP01026846.1:71-1432(+)